MHFFGAFFLVGCSAAMLPGGLCFRSFGIIHFTPADVFAKAAMQSLDSAAYCFTCLSAGQAKDPEHGPVHVSSYIY